MRSAEALLAAVDAEDVLHNPLYLQGRLLPGTTWCNLFTSNVTKRLGVEIPFKLVNQQAKWIRSEGSKVWHWCDAVEAFERANKGYPTIPIWEGPEDSHGHIAVCVPSYVLGVGKENQIAIAQSGRTNFPRGRLAQGFDSLPVRFYTAE